METSLNALQSADIHAIWLYNLLIMGILDESYFKTRRQHYIGYLRFYQQCIYKLYRNEGGTGQVRSLLLTTTKMVYSVVDIGMNYSLSSDPRFCFCCSLIWQICYCYIAQILFILIFHKNNYIFFYKLPLTLVVQIFHKIKRRIDICICLRIPCGKKNSLQKINAVIEPAINNTYIQ